VTVTVAVQILKVSVKLLLNMLILTERQKEAGVGEEIGREAEIGVKNEEETDPEAEIGGKGREVLKRKDKDQEVQTGGEHQGTDTRGEDQEALTEDVIGQEVTDTVRLSLLHSPSIHYHIFF